MPLTGNPAYNPGNNGFTNDTTGAHRLFPAEAISFGQRLRFTIQHGPTDDQPANYSSVAFWYGQPTYSLQVTDALNTTDQASRATHQTSCNRILEVFEKKEKSKAFTLRYSSNQPVGWASAQNLPVDSFSRGGEQFPRIRISFEMVQHFFKKRMTNNVCENYQ
jgi:hypothetical protein